MKKILYIVSTLKKSGPTNQLSYIVKYLDKSKYEPIVLTLSPESQRSMMDYFQLDLKIRVASLNLSRIEGMLYAKKIVEHFIIDNRIDLLHTQGFRADVLSSRLKINIPRIATIRNYPQLDFLMTYGSIVGAIMTKLQTKALKKLTLCCGVSDAVANNLNDNFRLTNIVTVRNGVDVNRYFPLSINEQNEIRKYLKIPLDKTIWITSIGKDLRKDSTIIAKAFKKLYENDRNNFIIFMGDGKLKAQCENILKGIDDVLFTGKINNVLDYLQSSHYFISSSQAEGLPNAVLEAMACGLPQILSDIEPHKEIIDLDTKAGIVYETGSAEELCKSMKQIVTYKYEEMRKSVLNLIQNSFEASVMSKKYQDIYENLLAGDL